MCYIFLCTETSYSNGTLHSSGTPIFCIEGGHLEEKFALGVIGTYRTIYSRKFSQIGRVVAELQPFCRFCTFLLFENVAKMDISYLSNHWSDWAKLWAVGSLKNSIGTF